jgi:formylglycine-generating enzyme required for sulfatase activity
MADNNTDNTGSTGSTDNQVASTTNTATAKPQWLLITVLCVIGIAGVFLAYNEGREAANGVGSTGTSTGTATQNQSAAQSTTSGGVPKDMILIPAGEFIMGTDEVDASGKSQEFGFNEPLYLNEHPKREVNLDAYYIDKYEVTNEKFKSFLRNLSKYTPQQIQMLVDRLQMKQDNLPVRNITWFKADEYCRFVGKRLPTEAEWEKAARGTDGREFPWGNKWNADYVNAGQGEADVMPVGSYEKGKSPYGVYDMAGNVMEWTADWYEPYPGAEYKSPNYGHKRRVARGGSWGGVGHYVIPHYFRTEYRFNFPPDQAFNDVGFRCAKDVP